MELQEKRIVRQYGFSALTVVPCYCEAGGLSQSLRMDQMDRIKSYCEEEKDLFLANFNPHALTYLV